MALLCFTIVYVKKTTVESVAVSIGGWNEGSERYFRFVSKIDLRENIGSVWTLIKNIRHNLEDLHMT